jgi:hypothetical protein|tara:strand:+ start:700 stop:1590 length:891 start_codon:yes stop_codon:yes gene_type:complete
MTVAEQFDWYQATIQAPPKDVVDALAGSFADFHDVRHLDRGGHGFTESALLRDREGDTLALVRYGGNSTPNVQTTSHRAIEGSRIIRKHWPKHRVSRLDVAADFDGPGIYTDLVEACRGIADTHHMTSGREIKPDDPEAGRTYYLGAAASNVMLRVYEKGREQRAKGVKDAPLDWVRTELQVRPQKAAKSALATIEPAEVWGASKWSVDVGHAVVARRAARIVLDPRDEPDAERTMGVLAHQYRLFALDYGTRRCEVDHGQVDPSARDAIRAFCDALCARMIAEHEARIGTAQIRP